jgi:hypothetical protein
MSGAGGRGCCEGKRGDTGDQVRDGEECRKCWQSSMMVLVAMIVLVAVAGAVVMLVAPMCMCMFARLRTRQRLGDSFERRQPKCPHCTLMVVVVVLVMVV